MINVKYPSQNQKEYINCSVIYLGTALDQSNLINCSDVDLNQLQETISKRFPKDNSVYCKGIRTSLKVFPNGLQFEQDTSKCFRDVTLSIFYPIKSLIYCGALKRAPNTYGQFVPIDGHGQRSHTEKPSQFPPIFVTFFRIINPITKRSSLECHLFMVNMIGNALRLVKYCKKAYNSTVGPSVREFFNIFGSIPAMNCFKQQVLQKHMGDLKEYDKNGYFYALDVSSIEIWQILDENRDDEDDDHDEYHPDKQLNHINFVSREGQQPTSTSNRQQATSMSYRQEGTAMSNRQQATSMSYRQQARATNERDDRQQMANPNMLKFSQLLNAPTECNTNYPDLNYLAKVKNDSFDDEIFYHFKNGNRNGYNMHNFRPTADPNVFVREMATPSPIIIENYVKEKAPQVIIKDIYGAKDPPPAITSSNQEYMANSKRIRMYDDDRDDNDYMAQMPMPQRCEPVPQLPRHYLRDDVTFINHSTQPYDPYEEIRNYNHQYMERQETPVRYQDNQKYYSRDYYGGYKSRIY